MEPGERVVLDPQDLDRMLRDGEVDTVLCALPDLWGRLVGKRVAARAFRRILNEGGGVNASLYLFVVDMDMEPLPGFALTDWDRGFQDFLMLPDLSTLRLVPWLERTALVLCDAVIERTGEPVEVSPRQILKRQIRLAADQGLAVKCGSELEVFFFTDGYRDAWARQYRELHPMSDYRADYHLLQTTKDEWLIKRIRLGMEAAGVPIEFSKGEWGLGQHEINMEYALPCPGCRPRSWRSGRRMRSAPPFTFTPASGTRPAPRRSAGTPAICCTSRSRSGIISAAWSARPENCPTSSPRM